ncbi:hypothetical protein B0H12DRAFT_1024988, partial [Mycena haematopus]
MEAVARYHGHYDPSSSTEEDPLLEYGALAGEIPGVDPAASLALRDALIRYTKPHRSFDWTNLSELIAEVGLINADKVGLLVSGDALTQGRFYCLNLGHMARVAHAVVAVQQILGALTVFLNKDPATSFVLDPGYGFLLMLERCPSAIDIRFALGFLQMRLQRADKHIALYLRSIKETLTNEEFSETCSSVDSTISEVRREFGTQAPGKELARLMLRKDY